MHQHWYRVVQDHGEEAVRQQPYDSITIDDWTTICQQYEDPAYQITHLIFFYSLMTESFILKLNFLSTNFIDNFTETMCLKCGEPGETDRAALWGFEIVCSSYGVHGR